VFDASLASARRLLGGLASSVMRVEGDSLHIVALTTTSPEGDGALRATYPRPLSGLHMDCKRCVPGLRLSDGC